MNIDRIKRERAKEKISFYLRAEKIRPGERLPSERKLCDVLGVSRITVRSALSELIEEGILGRNAQNIAVVGKLPRSPRPIQKGKQSKIVFAYFPSQEKLFLKEIGIFSKVYQGIERHVHSRGDIIFSQTGANFLSMNSDEKSTIGGIIATGALMFENRIDALRSAGVPVIIVNCPHCAPELNSVSCDFFEAGQDAVLRRKANKSRRHILFLSIRFGDEQIVQPPLLEIWRGAMTAAWENGTTISRLDVAIREDDWIEAGLYALKTETDKLPPSEIIAGSGQLYPLLKAFSTERKSKGVVLRVVDGGWIERPDSNIDVISLDTEACGLSASRRLYDLMVEPAQRPLRILLPARKDEKI